MEFLVENLPRIAILACLFFFLYIMGGDDIVFFRRKKYKTDPKSAEKLTNALNKFARLRGFEVLGRTTLEYNGTVFTFDNIILGFFGTVAFNAVSYSGDIYGEAGSDTWVQVFEGKRTSFENPVKALNGSVKFLKDIYREEKAKCGQAETMAVFTAKNVNVAVARSIPVCHVDELAKKLDVSKYLADNGADVAAMKAALEKYTK